MASHEPCRHRAPSNPSEQPRTLGRDRPSVPDISGPAADGEQRSISATDAANVHGPPDGAATDAAAPGSPQPPCPPACPLDNPPAAPAGATNCGPPWAAAWPHPW